jgi:hypothetical protein
MSNIGAGVPSGEASGFGVVRGEGSGMPSPSASDPDFDDVVKDLDVIRLTLERADRECRAWKSEAEQWKSQAELWKTHYSEECKLTRFLLVIFVIMLVPVAIAAAVLVNLYVG